MDINLEMVRFEKWAGDNPSGVFLIIAVGIALVFVLVMAVDALTSKRRKKNRKKGR